MLLLFKRLKVFYFCSWRLKVLVFALKDIEGYVLKEVEGFYFCSWRLKVFIFALKDIEGSCS